MGISSGRGGYIIYEDLELERSPRSGFRNAWTWIKKSMAQDIWKTLQFFGVIPMISCRKWWPWTKPGYITMTRRQSNNQYVGVSGQPRPKKLQAKILASTFVIKETSYSLIIFQDAKLSMRNITQLFWRKLRTVWRENASEISQILSVFARKFFSSPGNCNQEETGPPDIPVSPSSTLFSGSTSDGLPPVPCTELKFVISSDAMFIAAAETFLDGQKSELFWVACKI